VADLDALIRELVGLLEREAALLAAAADRLAADRRAFVSGSAAVLSAAEGERRALLDSRAGRDRERALLLDRIAAMLGERPDKLTVSRIRARLGARRAEALERAAASAAAAARRALLEASVGGELLEESARVQEGLIRRICEEAGGRARSYARDEGSARPALSLLDTLG